jgi:hypothetical protein
VADYAAVRFASGAEKADVDNSTCEPTAMEELLLDFLSGQRSWKCAARSVFESKEGIRLVGNHTVAEAQCFIDRDVFHARDKGTACLILIDSKYHGELIELP